MKPFILVFLVMLGLFGPSDALAQGGVRRDFTVQKGTLVPLHIDLDYDFSQAEDARLTLWKAPNASGTGAVLDLDCADAPVECEDGALEFKLDNSVAEYVALAPATYNYRINVTPEGETTPVNLYYGTFRILPFGSTEPTSPVSVTNTINLGGVTLASTLTLPALITESIEDRIGAVVAGAGCVDVTYDDVEGEVLIDVSACINDETIQDVVGALMLDGTGLDCTYSDATPSLICAVTGAPWAGITGKPATFPPSTHGHGALEIAVSAISGVVADDVQDALVEAYARMLEASDINTEAEFESALFSVTVPAELTAGLATKANTSHTHAGADITSGEVADARLPATIARDSELPTPGGSTGHVQYEGAGNTFAGESAFAWDAANDRLAIGPVSPSALLHLSNETATEVNADLYHGSANGPVLRFRKARGTAAAPALPATSDLLGSIEFQGYTTNGAGFLPGSMIYSRTSIAQAHLHYSTLVFATRSTTNGGMTDRLTIHNDGTITLNGEVGLTTSLSLAVSDASTSMSTSTAAIVVQNTNTGLGNYAGVQFKAQTGSILGYVGVHKNNPADQTGGDLVFATKAGTAAGLTEYARLKMGGSFLFGTTSDLSAQVGIVNGTASNSALVVRGHASQSGNLAEFQNSAGSVLARIASSGAIAIGTTVYGSTNLSGPDTYSFASKLAISGGHYLANFTPGFGLAFANGTNATQTYAGWNAASLTLASGFNVGWSDVAHGSNFTSAARDVGLSRNAAGVLEVNNGTAGQYRDLRLRAINPAGGNVGFGTTNPDGSIEVASSLTGSGFKFGYKGTGTITSADNHVYGMWMNHTLTPGNTKFGISLYGGGIASVTSPNTIKAASVYAEGITKTGTGTISDLYGVYIAQPTAGTNNYGLYSVGGNNYFGGNVGIGAVPSLAPLHVETTNPSQITSVFINRGAASSTGGAGIVGYHDAGAAMQTGQRLGYYGFGGAIDASGQLVRPTLISSFAAENFTAGNQGAYISFETTPTGSSTASRAERMRINPAGSIGISTTGPDRKLDVLDATNPQIRLTQTDGSFYTDLHSDAQGHFVIQPSGGASPRVYARASGTGVLSSFINHNTSTDATAGTGFLFAAGNADGYIGGAAAQRIDAAANARLCFRVLSNAVLSTCDTASPFYIEGVATGAKSVFNTEVQIGSATDRGAYGLQVTGSSYFESGSFQVAHFKRTGTGGAGFSLENASGAVLNFGNGGLATPTFFAGASGGTDNFIYADTDEFRVQSGMRLGFSSHATTPEAAVSDTYLYRSAAGTLRTPGRLIADGNVLIGTTTDDGVNRVQVNGQAYVSSRIGIGVTPATALDVVGTATSGNQNGVQFSVTGSGSDANPRRALFVDLLAGYTGSGITQGLSLNNYSAGSGNVLAGTASMVGNVGTVQAARGASSGLNIGGYGWGGSGLRNVGFVGDATLFQNGTASGLSIGVVGYALRAHASAVQVGGYFGLQSGEPTFESAALVADNGSQTSPIFLARDNGATVFSILDGGNVTLTGTVDGKDVSACLGSEAGLETCIGVDLSLTGHTHTIANVTGLQTALDGKIGVGDLDDDDTTINESDDPVHWTQLKGVPAGFADGTDDGAGGGGAGDMLQEDYDVDTDGVVDLAEAAPWAGITDKPATFTPSAHVHAGEDVTTGTVAEARIAAAITRDTEWDTIAEIETATGANIITPSEDDDNPDSDAEVPNALTIAGGTIGTSAITLVQGTAPTPTAEGVVEWETDAHLLHVGNGGTTSTFYPGAHTVDTDDQTASEVTSTATGDVAAVTVQSAIAELASEKAALAGAAFTGAVSVAGDLTVASANGRVWGITGLVAGHTVNFYYGGAAANSIESTYGLRSIFKSYHGLTVQNDPGGVGVSGPALIVKGHTSQNLQEWHNHSGTVYGIWGPTGMLRVGGNTNPTEALSVTGNIAVSGTVDGKDVSACLGGESGLETCLGVDLALSSHTHAASAVTSTATGDVAATNVQAAIAELASEKLAASANNDAADAVSLADVQAAVSNDFHNIGGTDDDIPDSDAEVPNVLTIAGGTIGTSIITLDQSTTPTPTAEGVVEWETDAHLLHVGNGGATSTFHPGAHTVDTDDQTAGEVTSTATGDVAATTVQTAIAELASEKATDADLDTHTGATAAHGATGAVVGTTNAQTLTDKTLDADDNVFQDIPVVLQFAISDQTSTVTAGTAKLTFRAPFAFTLTGARLSAKTASSSGLLTVDVNEAGSSVFSTLLTLDATEKTSTTAATAVVISDSAIADDAEITIDIDIAGTGTVGPVVTLIGKRSY